MGTQFHFSRYAFLFESLLLNDAVTISPPIEPSSNGGNSMEEGPGLKAIAESIDNRDDFKNFMQNYAVTFAASGQKALRREGPPEEGFVRVSLFWIMSIRQSWLTISFGLSHRYLRFPYRDLPRMAHQASIHQHLPLLKIFPLNLKDYPRPSTLELTLAIKCSETMSTYQKCSPNV